MQALAELLKVTHRGYFIPPRPEKNPVEGQRASDEFVELRRSGLEKYLVQLALHPAIAQSDVSLCPLSADISTSCLLTLSFWPIPYCWDKHVYAVKHAWITQHSQVFAKFGLRTSRVGCYGIFWNDVMPVEIR